MPRVDVRLAIGDDEQAIAAKFRTNVVRQPISRPGGLSAVSEPRFHFGSGVRSACTLSKRQNLLRERLEKIQILPAAAGRTAAPFGAS